MRPTHSKLQQMVPRSKRSALTLCTRLPTRSVSGKVIGRRQRGRARVMALLLGAFVILVFAISIAKIQAGMPHG